MKMTLKLVTLRRIIADLSTVDNKVDHLAYGTQIGFHSLIRQYCPMENTMYDRLGGENLTLLVDRFYNLVFSNEQISHLFKTDKDLIKEKQRLFLTQFLGGPPLYSEVYGHPKLRARHLPHPIHQEDAVAWLQCMSAAITSLPIEQTLKDELFKTFIPTAMFMVNSEG